MVGGNDYVIQVKGNQKFLKKALIDYAEKNDPDDIYIKREKNRGRTENRKTRVFRSVKGGEFDKWVKINEIIEMTRWGKRSEKSFKEVHYFISSRKQLSAQNYAKRIREHWWIENKLHWVKDVILYEDNSLVKGKDLSENLSLLRMIVMNLFRINNLQSVKYAIEKFSNKLDKCELFIYDKFSTE